MSEAARVAQILANDSAQARAERRRREAEAELAEGRTASADDAVVPPTPELLGQGDFHPIKVPVPGDTVRTVETVRRRSQSRVAQLHNRGVLDDRAFAACMWYRRAWQDGDLEPSIRAMDYEPRISEAPIYGMMARSERQVEARRIYRAASGVLSDRDREAFEFVVLRDGTLSDLARLLKLGTARTAIRFAEICAPIVEHFERAAREKEARDRLFA